MLEIQTVVLEMCHTMFLVADKWLKVIYFRGYHRFLPAPSPGPYKHCKSLEYFFGCTILSIDNSILIPGIYFRIVPVTLFVLSLRSSSLNLRILKIVHLMNFFLLWMRYKRN